MRRFIQLDPLLVLLLFRLLPLLRLPLLRRRRLLLARP
jgi:hypothetical protein